MMSIPPLLSTQLLEAHTSGRTAVRGTKKCSQRNKVSTPSMGCPVAWTLSRSVGPLCCTQQASGLALLQSAGKWGCFAAISRQVGLLCCTQQVSGLALLHSAGKWALALLCSAGKWACFAVLSRRVGLLSVGAQLMASVSLGLR